MHSYLQCFFNNYHYSYTVSPSLRTVFSLSHPHCRSTCHTTLSLSPHSLCQCFRFKHSWILHVATLNRPLSVILIGSSLHIWLMLRITAAYWLVGEMTKEVNPVCWLLCNDLTTPRWRLLEDLTAFHECYIMTDYNCIFQHTHIHYTLHNKHITSLCAAVLCWTFSLIIRFT